MVGVPKTIDNDILLMDKTFGFDTAVEEAQRAINSAYIEVTFIDFSCCIITGEFMCMLIFLEISLLSSIVLLFFLVLEVVI